MNELKEHKKSDKIKWIITGIAIVLIFVMLAGICMQIFGKGKFKPTEWFKKPETEQTTPIDNDELIIGDGENNGVQLLSARIAPEDYTEYCVSTQAETAYILTATIYPDDATIKAVDWSALSKSGNPVTESLLITPLTDLSAKVECLKAFGEQIIITCSARPLIEGDAVPSATCTVDYYKRITGMSLRFWGWYSDSDEESYAVSVADGDTLNFTDFVEEDDDHAATGNELNVFETVTVGTIFDTAVNVTVKLSIADSVAASIKSAAGVSQLGSYELVTNGCSSGLEIKSGLTQILGGSGNVNNHRSALYNAFKTAYDNGTAALTFHISCVGDRSGFEYSFDLNLFLNPQALGTRATGVNLNNSNFVL